MHETELKCARCSYGNRIRFYTPLNSVNLKNTEFPEIPENRFTNLSSILDANIELGKQINHLKERIEKYDELFERFMNDFCPTFKENKDKFESDLQDKISEIAHDIANNHRKIIDDWCKAYMAQLYMEGHPIIPGNFILYEQDIPYNETQRTGIIGKRYWFKIKDKDELPRS